MAKIKNTKRKRAHTRSSVASRSTTPDLGVEGPQARSSPAASETMPTDKRAKFEIHFDVANKSDDEVLGMLA